MYIKCALVAKIYKCGFLFFFISLYSRLCCLITKRLATRPERKLDAILKNVQTSQRQLLHPLQDSFKPQTSAHPAKPLENDNVVFF